MIAPATFPLFPSPFHPDPKEPTMAIEKALYTATATATGGRAGTAKSSDGVLDLALSTPKELGGAGAPAPTPSSCSPLATAPASSAR